MRGSDLQQQLEALHPRSFSWSLTCCDGNHAEAEDVLQTTYVKILDGQAKFAGRSSLKTWLFAVIRRTAADRRRTQVRRKNLLTGFQAQPTVVPDSPSPGHPSEHPVAHLDEERRRRRIRTAVGQLSPRQRQVLELVFYHELTLKQAAELLGVAIGTARIHYDRGKKQLLHQLDSLRPQ